jgi:hypothetical protein
LDGFGVTVHLGEAESGLFAYPDDAGALYEAYLVDIEFSGYRLEGLAYGSVDGLTNRSISSLWVTRVGWGQYMMSVDFTPLGATGYTYEVFSDGHRTLVATNQGSCSGVSTYDIEPGVPPRANPVWRLTDGIGAVIEFPRATRIFVCGGASGVGERFVIRPEGATSRVDYVSRVDIVGSDGLPRFGIQDERIGMFGLAHRALGSVAFAAAKDELTLTGFDTSTNQGMQGVMVEVPRGLRWEGAMHPLTLSNDHSAVLLSAAGTSSTNLFGTFYGPAGVGRTNGTGNLLADFSELSATGVIVEAISQGVVTGRVIVPVMGSLGTLGATNPTIVSCSAGAWNDDVAAWFSFKLAEPTTFTTDAGLQLSGDEFRLSPAESGEAVGTLKHVVLHGVGLERLTLTNELSQVEPVPPLALDIRPKDAGVTMSWPVTPDYHLVSKNDLSSGAWGYAGVRGYHYADFRLHAVVTNLTNAARFYRLEHDYEYYIRP